MIGFLLQTPNLGAVMGNSISQYIGYAPWAVLIGILGGVVLVIRARKQQAESMNIGMTGPYGNQQPAQQTWHLENIFSFLKYKSTAAELERAKLLIAQSQPQQSQPQPQPQQISTTQNNQNNNTKVDTMANGQPQGQQQGAVINMENTVNMPVSIWAANVINTLAKKHKRTETSIIDQLCDYYLQTRGQQQGGQQGNPPQGGNMQPLLQGLGRMSNDFMNGTGFWK